MLVYRHPVGLQLILLPVPILFAAIFTLGVALLVSTLAVLFTDIVDLYGVILQAWFFLTPIIYPVSILPPGIATYLRWNPAYLLVDQFRLLIYDKAVPSGLSMMIAAGIALSVLILGWLIFTKKVDELAYRI